MNTYPEISSDTFIDTMLHNSSKLPKEEQLPFDNPRAFLENCFIRATKNDAQGGLNGRLCRAEFFDCLLPVAERPEDTVCLSLDWFSAHLSDEVWAPGRGAERSYAHVPRRWYHRHHAGE